MGKSPFPLGHPMFFTMRMPSDLRRASSAEYARRSWRVAVMGVRFIIASVFGFEQEVIRAARI
jgi:hypothetical protein